MKILFSPSEAKTSLDSKILLSKDSFSFKILYKKRLEIILAYNKFIKTADEKEICKLFGLKNYDDSFRDDIFKKGCVKAMFRYDGVAYSHLNYRSLDVKSQEYIDKNVIIFSNLFGAIMAGDMLPEYKLKQGEKFLNLNIERHYKENFSPILDKFLQNDDILDLRAGYYEKFYEIKHEFYTFKFIKNGKIVSHYAKAYRGKILKAIALKQVSNKKELLEINFDGLKLIDIKKIGLKNEILFEICV